MFGFFLTEGFSLPAYTSIAETFRIANDISGEPLFRWCTVATTRQVVRSASGLSVEPDFDIKEKIDFDKLAVISSLNSHDYFHKKAFKWLKWLDQRGCSLGGITSGSWVLANANLLVGHRVTLHWHEIEAFKETHPNIEVSEGIYELDERRFSCAGGFAALDMILELMIREYGSDFAHKINQRLIKEHHRPGNHHQNIDFQTKSSVVRRAVRTMKNHIESPVSLVEVAKLSAISPRQLNTLFQKSFKLSPQQYYMKLRMNVAASLLARTELSITDVAVAVGFENLGHFSNSFTKEYQCSPSKYKRGNELKPG